VRGRLDPIAARDAWRAFLGSRLLVAAAAVFGAAALRAGGASLHAKHALAHPFDSWPASGVLDFLLSPLLRWDAHWYIQIARDGYDPGTVEGIARVGRPAFFPVYPMLVRLLGGFASTGAAVLAAYAISAAALLAALYLLHRLVTLELGAPVARATVLVVAFCPVAWFFSAPYTESLFLLESVGAVYAARTGRWATAGALAGVASATRNLGVVLLVPLLVIYLYNDRPEATVGQLLRRLAPARRPDRSILWLGLAPVGLIAFSVYLRVAVGDAQAWRRAQIFFGHQGVVNPLEGIRRGAVAAFHAVEGTLPADLRFPIVLEFGFLVFAVIALVAIFRTLPAPYAVYSLAMLVPAVCNPVVDEPLRSLPRYMLVVFPIWMWLARACERRGVTNPALVVSAAALAFLTAEFASWQVLV
jgi:hypothetical protein